MSKFSVVRSILLIALILSCLSGHSFASAEKPVIGLSLKTYSNPFFLALRDGVEEALKAAGGTLLENDSRGDVARQIDAVDEFIAQGVDAILLNAFDRVGSIAAVEAANAAQIPVITVDADASSGEIASFVASDNLLAGTLCAQYLVERLIQKRGTATGNVVIIDGYPSSAVLNRVQGFRDVLKQYPEIRILSTQQAKGNVSSGLEAMENALDAHREIDAVFAINDPSGLGALQTIEAAGRQQEIFVMGVDGARIALEAIQRGSAFVFTAAQDPVEIGRIGVATALKVLHGDDVESIVRVPVLPVTLDNVDELLKKSRF